MDNRQYMAEMIIMGPLRLLPSLFISYCYLEGRSQFSVNGLNNKLKRSYHIPLDIFQQYFAEMTLLLCSMILILIIGLTVTTYLYRQTV
jgi:hypothetical protein